MIGYDKNGYKIIVNPATGQNEGKTLMDINAYMFCLNEPSYAISQVDAWGGYTDPYRFAGSYVATSKDTFGIVFGHEFNPFIYRGENKDYEHFVPSALRFNLSNTDNRIKHCIDFIKKQEFIYLFKETPYYKRCENFNVLNCKFKFDLEAVAQHYEFISNYLDITKDLLTAMFFAYTYQKDGKYYPITDFEKYQPTLYVGNLKNLYKRCSQYIKLIGFQALLRPFLQKAMAVQITKEDIIKPLFEKITLPKSSAFSFEIYHKYQKGASIFPLDFTGILVQEVKNRKTLNEEYFKIYCNVNNLNEKEILEEIHKQGYSLTNAQYELPETLINGMNREIDDEIIPFLDRYIGFRDCSEPLRRGEIYE